METLDADLQLLTSRTCSVEENIQKDTELLQQLDSFLQVTLFYYTITNKKVMMAEAAAASKLRNINLTGFARLCVSGRHIVSALAAWQSAAAEEGGQRAD